MNKQIILNLPVQDLNKSKAFFSAFGFTFDGWLHPKSTRFRKNILI